LALRENGELHLLRESFYLHKALDQFVFLIPGYNTYIWMRKPVEALAFAVFDSTAGVWKFRVKEDGEVQIYGHTMPQVDNAYNLDDDTHR